MRYGSDLIIEHLARLGIEVVTLNPGASIRGLHDSLVRGAGPQMLLALHEEIAVGIAHGYAKSAGKPAAVFVHDLVGLQHASMAIFNAWADAVPMLVVGGSGPRDAASRRPWIDWVHTGLPQGSLVRDFVKWDDEPGSLAAVPDSLNRGMEIALRAPRGPVYVSLDVALQECEAEGVTFPPPPLVQATTVAAPREAVEAVADALRTARHPVVVVDLPQRGLPAALVRLVDLTGADVIDLGGGANFPSTHEANQTHRRREVLEGADLVVALDVRDLLWAVAEVDQATRRAVPVAGPDTVLVSVALSELQVRGFVSTRSYVPGARNVVGDPVALVEDLTRLLSADGTPSGPSAASKRQGGAASVADARADFWAFARGHADSQEIHPAYLAACVWEAIQDGPWQLANGRLDGWVQRLWDVSAEDHFLGLSGGHGLGYGLPASLGAALARRGTGDLVVNLQGDGDLMYVPSALWTAARYRLPLLTIVQNNRSYGKDELHQTEVARTRGRSEDVVGVGIHIDEPDVSYSQLAEAQGVTALGPVEEPAELSAVLAEAVRVVREERRPVLVDVVCPIPGSRTR